MPKKGQHGGPRPGSGPKPKPDKKLPISAKVTPDVHDYLRQSGNLSVTIDEVVRRTASFRRWMAKRD